MYKLKSQGSLCKLQVPNGELNAKQMRFLGDSVRKYGEKGCLDITTRANIQLRGIPLEDAGAICSGLQEVGLSSVQTGMWFYPFFCFLFLTLLVLAWTAIYQHLAVVQAWTTCAARQALQLPALAHMSLWTQRRFAAIDNMITYFLCLPCRHGQRA